MLEIGATNFIDSANLFISNPLLENELAITSATLPVSDASIPKPLRVPAATVAASAKSDPVAAAKSSIPLDAAFICLESKPNLASSVDSSNTSEAVKAVVAPNSLAFCFKTDIPSLVSPEIDCTFDRDASNSLDLPIRDPIPAINDPTATTIAPIPEEVKAAVIDLKLKVAFLAATPTPPTAPAIPVAAAVPLLIEAPTFELTSMCTFLVSLAIICDYICI